MKRRYTRWILTAKLEIAGGSLFAFVAEQDLRNPAKERHRRRLAILTVLAVTTVAVGAAAFTAISNRPNDHSYVFTASYGNRNGVAYTVMLPMPADPDIRMQWRLFEAEGANASAAMTESPYGTVLRVSAWGNITVTARYETWRDLPIGFTTEGINDAGRPAARVNLDSAAPSLGSLLKVSFSKTDPQWTITHEANGDLFEGWNTVEIRETKFVTPSY